MAKRNLIKKPAVAAKLGICTKTVDKLVGRGTLPPPIELPGITTHFWDEPEIDALVEALLEQRDTAA